ncbi:serine/threonine-protein kinase [Engelhardtia mirabilis]|uniref:Serine/threonine-protein kinase PknB n=1 Tax=Engelhardtia mirabilis TaxID=2528011 RepID=A0A518BFV9_9BACT|nr:Serine/threonine-protein kinase PknB [Planctomycetes bacterium Pla133]QDV00196.1 Serine/threonine-protein kinase PknB [Planctomycetes bacterium Pla86]
MSGADHDALAAAFEGALEVEGVELANYLAQLEARSPDLARRVAALLEADGAAGARLLDRPASARAAEALDDLARGESAQFPESIGSYRILRELGRGGMGIVYEAEQERPRRRVAIKVLRADAMDAAHRRRFELEGEVLARLEHPGIARVYDVGTADGPHGPRPFIAMELVDGPRLDDHATQRRLDLTARVRLLVRVADAVAHAHSRGIVHRDLKPGNVLVDASGQPRVLDFGIARALHMDGDSLRTRTGELWGTLAYMSPEQAAGDGAAIGTPSDVWALGVIGYRLLTGRLPFEVDGRSLPEALRALERDDPPAPSSFAREVRGDLETILLHALEREPERRYATAAQFAADLRRFLDDEPIAARPPSATYQLAKFARRHRPWVLGAAAAVLALLAGTIVSTALFVESQARGERLAAALEAAREATAEAQTQRAEADDQRRRAQSSVDELLASEQFFDEMLGKASPYEDGDAVRVVDVLERSVAALHGFTGPPLLRARLLSRLGGTLHSIGRSQEAVPLLEQAIDLYVERGEGQSVQRARAEGLLALARWNRSQAPEVLADFRRALELYEDIGLGGDASAVRLRMDLINALTVLSFLDQAQVESERVIELARVLGPEYGTDLAQALLSQAHVAMAQGRFAAAESSARESVERMRRAAGPESVETYGAEHVLSALLYYRGECSESRELAEHSLAGLRRVIGGDHPELVGHLEVICVASLELGDLERAASAIDEAVAMAERIYDADSVRRANLLVQRAGVREASGNDVAAHADYREAIATMRASGSSVPLAAALALEGALYQRLGQSAEAIPLLEESIAMHAALVDPLDLRLADSLRTLGLAYQARGEWEPLLETQQRLVENLRLNEDLVGREARVESLAAVGEALLELGRNAEALEELGGHWPWIESVEDADLRAVFGLQYGAALWRTGDRIRGAQLVRECADQLDGLLGHGERRTRRLAEVEAASGVPE